MLDIIPFSQSPYFHNLAFSETAVNNICYSGRWIVHIQQWGVYVINADTGVFKMKSPVGKNDPTFQPPSHAIVGDCWQSGVNLSATPGSPKWIVVTGTPNFCPDIDTSELAGQIQVLSLDDTINPLNYVGQIFSTKIGRVGAYARIFGDIAYVRQKQIGLPPNNIKWTKIDLNALTVLEEDLISVPDYVPQTEIDGFTYRIVPIYPDPIPPDFITAQDYNAVRSDYPITPPPNPGLPVINISVQVAPVPAPLASLTQTAPGTGYTVASATVTGGGGSGATINTVVNLDGSITLTLSSPGTGYISQPSVHITGDGSGAAAHVNLAAPTGTVEYFVDGVSIGSTSHFPYDMTFQPSHAGTYKLEARLTRGLNVYSDTVFFTVTSKFEGGIVLGAGDLTSTEA